MKLYGWNTDSLRERFYYLLFGLFISLLTANYYAVLIEHNAVYIINFFAIIFSVKLFKITERVQDAVLKTQIFQVISLSVVLFILSFLPIPLWFVVTFNNFFGIVYFYFFYLLWEKYKDDFKLIQPYVSIVHLFFLIYLFVLNIQVYFIKHEQSDFVMIFSHVQVGVQYLLLVISMLTYIFFNKDVKEKEFDTFFDPYRQVKEDVRKKIVEENRVEKESETYRLKYKNQELAEQILEFFEIEKTFLSKDFTLEILCQYIPNSNIQQASFVINNHLNTSFYKLVAYHRIMYSLKLVVSKSDWTLVAIAEECGFRSVNTFNKYFKDLTGFSPVEYRIVIEKSKEKL